MQHEIICCLHYTRVIANGSIMNLQSRQQWIRNDSRQLKGGLKGDLRGRALLFFVYSPQRMKKASTNALLRTFPITDPHS